MLLRVGFLATILGCLNLVRAAEPSIVGTYTIHPTPYSVAPTATGDGYAAYAPYTTAYGWVECYVTMHNHDGGNTAKVPVYSAMNASPTSPPGLQCYRIIEVGGGILRVPLPHADDPISIQTALPGQSDSTKSPSNPPAIGSLAIILISVFSVFAVLIVAAIILIVRRRKAQQTSKQAKGAWVKRFSWANNDIEAPAISKPMPIKH